MQKLSDYMQVAEAAEIVGVSQNTLQTWAANGYRLFKREDLEWFLKITEASVRTKLTKRTK